MKIFITGSTGFIGRNLVEFYGDHDIFEYKRGSNIAQDLDFFNPDLIINSAAEIYKPEFMWDSNVVMVRHCLEFVKKSPNCKMIQIGSSAEYGPMPRPSSEKDKINPVDMYQATKGAATLICQGYARSFNLNIKIARPYSVYGKYEKPHRLFPRLLNSFISNVPMTLYDGYHDFIYIDDFIRGIDILVKDVTGPVGDIVNFGSGIQYSNLEVLELWEKVVGHSAPVNFVKTMVKSFESSVWVCDTEYAQTKYNFSTNFDLESGIKHFIDTSKI